MRAAIFLVVVAVAGTFPVTAAAADETRPDQTSQEEALIVSVDDPSDRSSVVDVARDGGGSAEVLDDQHIAVEVDRPSRSRIEAIDGVEAVREDSVAMRALDESVPWTGAPSLWAEGVDGTGSVIAIIDDGVDKSHQLLAGSVVAEACFTDGHCSGGDSSVGPNSAVPCGGCSHGTLVAGVARANSTILRGMANDSSLFPVQVFGCGTCGAYMSDLVSALDHIRTTLDTTAVDVVNMSLSFVHDPPLPTDFYSGLCDSEFPALSAAVNRLVAEGVVVAVASGNQGVSTGLPAPACLENVVAVASSREPGAFSSFSNRGPGTDVSAPGSDITTTAPGNSFAEVDGTSFAAPHVAGAIALLRDLEPALRVDQITSLLTTPHRTVSDGVTTLPELALDQLRVGLPAGSLVPGSVRISGNYQPIVANFSGDARTEILWYAPGGTPDYLWSADERGQFASRYRPVGGTYRPVVGDFDGNGYDDIIWYAPGSAADYVWWTDGTGAFTSRPISIGGTYTTIVGSFDAAPGDELIFYAPGTRTDYQWTTGGSRSFRSESRRINGTYEPIVVDIVQNSRDEILWRSGGPDYLWTYSPSGSVTSVGLAAPGETATIGDFDGNGKEDIAWAGPTTELWWGSAGAAGSSTTVADGPDGTFVAADVDGDGHDELLDAVPGSTGDVVWSFSDGRQRTVGPAPIDHDGQVLVLDIGTIGRSDLLVYSPGVDDLLLTSVGA